MRRIALTLGLLTLWPATAQAHPTRWYWSQGLAAQELTDRYPAIQNAACDGWGRTIRLPSGRKGFKHFDCYVLFDDGEEDAGELHVRGKYRFKFVWD